ncbi:MAG TPA: hypothetical protein VKR58_03125, partial [Aquella sp.]|nr:hypothetical protein [Aquella sp.]
MYIILRIKRKLKLMLFNNRIDKASIIHGSHICHSLALCHSRGGGNPLNKTELNIWGYLNYIFGISTTTRDFIHILSGKFKEFNLIPLRITTKSQVKDFELSALGQIGYPQISSNINLLFVNADSMADFYAKNHKYLRGKYNIAVYWWEFPNYLSFPGIFDNIDEVLVFSSVCY